MIALLVARVATFALFRLALPAVLGVLAALFGKSLERAAQRSAQIGRQGEEALVRALSQLRTAQPDETQSEEQPRLRVDPLSEADSDEDSDDASSERRAARHRS